MKYINDLEELKSIQLNILVDVDRFCRENNIRYFMCGGTLIGAVRHKGFIPWDDDIDIMMLREDYSKFIKLYSKEKGYYKVFDFTLQNKYPHAYAKVADERTVLMNEIHGAIQMGVNIDVFPIDDLPDDKESVVRIIKKSLRLNNILSLKQIKYNNKRSLYKNLALLIGRVLFCWYPTKNILKELNNNAIKYSHSQGQKCADLVAGFGYKEIQDRANLQDVIELPFENHTFFAPVGYDNYLRGMYGDYMQLPPVEKRVSHHEFRAWWK